MSRITSVEQNRERLASLGTMAAGLAHELNNPAAAARRAAAELAEALEVLGSTIGALRRVRRSSASRPRSWSSCSSRRSPQRARSARRSTRSTRPTPRTSCSDALEDARRARSRGGWPSRWPPPASTRRGSTRVAELAGPGDRRGAALGRGVAHRAAAWRPSCAESTERMSDAGRRGQVLRLHGPRRARRGRHARGPGDDAHGARPQAQAHRRSSSCATTTARCRS